MVILYNIDTEYRKHWHVCITHEREHPFTLVVVMVVVVVLNNLKNIENIFSDSFRFIILYIV